MFNRVALGCSTWHEMGLEVLLEVGLGAVLDRPVGSMLVEYDV